MSTENESTEQTTKAINTEKPSDRIQNAIIPMDESGVKFDNYDGLVRFANVVVNSRLAPKGVDTIPAVIIALQLGFELGLKPMAALQNIAVINGRPSLWGDSQLAVVRASGQLECFEEWYEQDGQRLKRNPTEYADTTTAVCRVKRNGYPEQEFGFSVKDAKTAKLWGKQGPWSEYPFRMLRFRARSFILRDTFGDALRGMLSAEEAGDLPERDVTPLFVQPTVEATPAPKIDTQPAPTAEPAPETRKRAKKAVEPEPAPIVADEPQTPLDELRGLMMDNEITEAEVIAAARKFNVPVKDSLAKTGLNMLEILVKDFGSLKASVVAGRKE